MVARTFVTRSRHELGFTLVELLVGLVLGLIIGGAVLAFAVSSLRVNSGYVRSTRLQQELRNTLSYIAGELKRAGYDDKAINRVGNPGNPPSPYSAILVNGSCVLYSYDRPDPAVTATLPATVSVGQGELRGIRLTTVNGRGVVEFAESSATSTPRCNDAAADYSTYPASCSGGWCPVTDPRVFEVTQLRFTLSDNRMTSTPLQMASRDMKVWLQGRLVGTDQEVVRAIDTTVKVRADCIRLSTAISQCVAAPAI